MTTDNVREEANAADYRGHLLELEMKLHAQQGFIDALQQVMHAAEHPPSDSEVMTLLERSLASLVEVTASEDGALMIQDEESGVLLVS